MSISAALRPGIVDLRETLDRPVSDYTLKDFVKVTINQSATDAAASMRDARATEAVVMDGDGLVGIVTERDILYKVVAEGKDPTRIILGTIMSAPVETIEETTRAADAIAKMSKLGVRRLGVLRKGRFVGLVTQMSLATGRLGDQVALPELVQPGSLKCPYCGVSASGSRELSRHIDQAHLGRGLLEGNVSKW